MPLRVAFFGTPDFAVPSLQALVRSPHTIAGVVCQPDRPRGRGQHVQPGAVALAAAGHELTVLQPARVKNDAFLDAVRAWRTDLAVVAAYGQLLPQHLLDLPRLGFINVHASLLPRWRGAAPVHRAILAGDTETGVTIMRVVLALDAGPMLARAPTSIDPSETSVALETRLAGLGADLLIRTIDRLATGSVDAAAQEDERSTYAPKLTRNDSRIDWTRDARTIHNQIRGLHPWPLAAAVLGDRRLLLLSSSVDPAIAAAAPGTVVAAGADGLVVATGSGSLRLLSVQPEGRRAMAVRDFLNGTRVTAGERFA